MRGTGRTTGAVLSAVCLAVVTPIARGGETPDAPSLEHEVLPLLKARCQKCHGPVKPKGKLNLSSARSLVRGGENGPVIVAGRTGRKPDLGPGRQRRDAPAPRRALSAGEKATLRRWIEQGAKGLPGTDSVHKSPPWTDHWAFGPASNPSPPEVRSRARVRTPIDRFIQRSLEDRGLTIGPDADRVTIIRRLSFDLTGIPPSLGEISRVCERS